MNNSNNPSRIISFINNIYHRSQNTSNTQDNNNNQVEEISENNQNLTRSGLETVWSRLQTLSIRQRSTILNAITNTSRENNDTQLFRRILRRRSEINDVSNYSHLNEKEEMEYVDYRSYPLKIDWKELVNKGSACTRRLIIGDISKYYGLFGVSLYFSFTNTLNLKLNEKNFIINILNYFIKSQETDSQNVFINELFIKCLPNMDSINEIIHKQIFSHIELFPIKIVLDINECYYRNKDFPLFQNYRKCLDISFDFYSRLDDEQTKYLFDNIVSNKEVHDILRKKLGSIITRNKYKYMKRLMNLKFENDRLTEGTNLSMFTY